MDENNNNAYVPNVHFELIPIKNLVSNQDYQRPISMKHVNEAVRDFDLYQINPVKVSRRDGINYVFNGQHTIEIVAKASGSRETPVWCMIYDDLSYTHEADIFANQMKNVKPLLPYEIFNANLEADNNEQILIRDLVNNNGLKLANNSGQNCITAISTIQKIYEKEGYEVLDRVLRLIVITWEGEAYSLSTMMLKAVTMIVKAYGDAISDALFKDRLRDYTAREIIRAARDKHNGTLGLAEEIINYMNRRNRTPIDYQPLYTLKKKKKVITANPLPDSAATTETADS